MFKRDKMDKSNLMHIIEPVEYQRVLQRDFFRISILEYEIEENGKAFELASKDNDILK